MAQNGEEKFRQIFFNSPAIRIIIEPTTGNILEVNQAAVRFYERSRNELLSMKIFDIIDADKEVISQYLASVDNSEKQFRFRHRLKNGEIRDSEVYSGLIDVEGKNIINSIVIDITEKRKAEEKLINSQERLALVIDLTKVGIWDVDMISNQVSCDERWKEIIGYRGDEISGGYGDEWKNRWHPDDASKIEQAIQDYVTGQSKKYEIEYRLRHRDGSYRWIHSNGKIIRDESGNPIRWVGFNLDITERKQVEEIRLESEMKLRDFAQAVPDFSFIVNEDGLYIEAFGKDNNSFSLPRENIIGHTIHEIFHKDDADFILGEVKKTIELGLPRYSTQEIKIAGTRKRWFEGRTVPMRYLANGKRTVAIITSDITEKLKNERMLRLTYELRRRSDFINELICGNQDINEDIKKDGKMFGIDLSQPLVCCLIDLERSIKLQDQAKAETDRCHIMNTDIIDILSDDSSLIIWECRESIGVLRHIENLDNEYAESAMLARAIRKKLLEYAPDMQVLMGVSDTNVGFASVKKCYQQAWSALMEAKSQSKADTGIHFFRDLGVLQLLTSISGQAQSINFVRNKIGKIIDYDHEKGTSLLLTLEEILQSANLKETAKKLFVHYKTILFRKQRIETILGVSLDEFETKTALSTAIKLHKLNSIK